MLRTRTHFRGGPSTDSSLNLDLRAKVRQLAGAEEDPAIAPIVDGIDPRLFTQLTPRQAARHESTAVPTF